jgi:nucleolar pre-ribosomal-associated protein 1
MCLARSKAAGVISAFQIVDWFRLLDYSPSPDEFGRVAAVVERCHKPALKNLIECLHPGEGLLWDGLKVVSRFAELRSW